MRTIRFIRSPAHRERVGGQPEADEVTVTVAGFIGLTYGDLRIDPDVYGDDYLAGLTDSDDWVVHTDVLADQGLRAGMRFSDIDLGWCTCQEEGQPASNG